MLVLQFLRKRHTFKQRDLLGGDAQNQQFVPAGDEADLLSGAQRELANRA